MGFFGLRPKDKPLVHKQIFQIIFHGRGGFTFDEVYNMPIYLRVFYLKTLEQYYQEEKAQYDKQAKKSRASIPKPKKTRVPKPRRR